MGLKGTVEQHRAKALALLPKFGAAAKKAEADTRKSSCANALDSIAKANRLSGQAFAEASWVPGGVSQHLRGWSSVLEEAEERFQKRCVCASKGAAGLKGLKKRKTSCKIVKGRKVCKKAKKR